MHSREVCVVRSPSVAARDSLEERQAELLRALVLQGPLPVGFDTDRADLLGLALIHKRSRAVARVWPAVSRSLGAGYEASFRTFARSSPLRVPHAVADGLAFTSWLGRSRLDDAACREVVAMRVRYAVSHRGVRLRRLPSVAVVRTRRGAIIAAVRMPVLGTTFICLSGRDAALPQRKGEVSHDIPD